MPLKSSDSALPPLLASVSRWMFLAAATISAVGLIMTVILAIIVVVPYQRERSFLAASCSFRSSRLAGFVPCSDLLNKKPNYNFPCLVATVRFERAGVAGTATMFMYFSYYSESTSASLCATRVCYRETSVTQAQIANFNRTLYNSGANFTCFVSSDSTGFVAIYAKTFNDTTVFHCLLWPLLAFGLGPIIMWCFWCFVGCDVWGSDIM